MTSNKDDEEMKQVTLATAPKPLGCIWDLQTMHKTVSQCFWILLSTLVAMDGKFSKFNDSARNKIKC